MVISGKPHGWMATIISFIKNIIMQVYRWNLFGSGFEEFNEFLWNIPY